MRLFSWLLFFILVLIEGSVTTLPLTLIFLLCLTVMKRQEWIFLLAFSAGILLDVFSFRQIGVSSLFFVLYIFLILLYQRKYETATMPFVIIASFFGCMIYGLLTSQPSVILQSLISTGITAWAFSLYRNMNRSSENDGFQHV